MFRHALKYLVAPFVTAALVVGFAPAITASAAPAASAAIVAAAPDCSVQEAALVASATKAKELIAALKSAKERVAKARKALRAADGAKATKKAARKLKQAKAAKRFALSRKNRPWPRCAPTSRSTRPARQAPTPIPTRIPTPTPPGVRFSPSATWVSRKPSATPWTGCPCPVGSVEPARSRRCVTSACRQAICAAATGLPLPGGASAIQPLCDVGLPQGICDVATGALNVGSLPIPAGLPGLPGFAFPGIPEVPGLDLLIGLLSPITGVLPLGTICGLIDIPIVCDLVAP